MDSSLLNINMQKDFNEIDEIWENYMSLMVALISTYTNKLYREPCMNSHFTGWKWIKEIMEEIGRAHV